MRRFIRSMSVVSGIILMSVALFGVLVQGQETPTPTSTPPHWTYEGEEGPENWGELDPAYALCGTGEGQSPIDLAETIEADITNIEFSYTETALNIFNNGHTIEVEYDAGSSIIYNENTYNLAQFHFHHPSEHTLDGETADMELHLVHKDAAGNLAVVGIMLVIDETPDADYAVIFDNLPAEKGAPQPTELKVNAADLLPDALTFYTYSGSLTTPPCSQGVRWLVLDTPVVISEAQAAAFTSIFELNARPVQPLNTRDLFHDIGG